MEYQVRRVFCHINEIPQHGWDTLPSLLLLADDVVLWTPAGAELQRLNNSGLSPFSTNDILRLVEAGIVKIAGRNDSIMSKSFRNREGAWDGQRWLDGFDDVVRSIAVSESRTRETDPKVIIINDERGFAWADEQISVNSKAFRLAKQLVKVGGVPFGTMERVKRLHPEGPRRTRAAAVRMVLRDARNHEDARTAVSADLALNECSFPVTAFNRIADVPAMSPHQEKIDRLEVRELFSWIRRQRYSGDVDTLISLRNDPAPRRQIWKLLTAGQHPLAELRDRVKAGLGTESFLYEAFGTGPLMLSNIAGAATAFLGLQLSRRKFCFGSMMSAAGALATGSSLAYVAARRNSVVSDTAYTGETWPFLLAYDTDAPNRAKIEHLIKELGEVLSKTELS